MTKTIALCGIDGTGKTSQAKLLAERLSDAGYGVKVLWCRWDPFLARPAIRLLDRLSRSMTASTSDSRDAVSQNRRRSAKRHLLSLRPIRSLWRAMMVLDYGLQTAVKLRRAKRGMDFLILDRYRYDVLIDLSAGGALSASPRLLNWLLPAPDTLLILDSDETLALQRKPDSPDVTYLMERRQLYLRLAEVSSVPVIDASSDLETVSQLIFEALHLQGVFF